MQTPSSALSAAAFVAAHDALTGRLVGASRGQAQIPYTDLMFESDPDMPMGRRQLGMGNFGVVYAASLRGVPVAVKEIPVRRDDRFTATNMNKAWLEATMQYRLSNHPRVVGVLGISMHDDPVFVYYCIVMHRMQMTLGALLRTSSIPLPYPVRLRLLWQAAQAGRAAP
jgi:serine/threonine protein kinase